MNITGVSKAKYTNRVVYLPPHIRQIFKRNRGMMSKALQDGIICHTTEAWEYLEATLKKLNPFNAPHQKYIKVITVGLAEFEIDQANRLFITQNLSRFLGISEEVFLIEHDQGIYIFGATQYQQLLNENSGIERQGLPGYLSKVDIFNLKKYLDIGESSKIIVTEINTQLYQEITRNPNILRGISSRLFEELVADMLMKLGYEVTLTKATVDGGVDIFAARKDDLGSFLYLVECKKYTPPNKVGVEILRQVYGTVAAQNATAGIIVTTSYFTSPAIQFQKPLEHKMSLVDFDNLLDWNRKIAGNQSGQIIT